MALPPALLQFVEHHSCFSGCYGSSSNVQTFVAPNQPPVPVVVVTCRDCYAQIGTPAALLSAGTSSPTLADQLTQHVRGKRGYSLSIGGYHTQGPGFYISAVYWASCRLFLINGERSRKLGTDLDLLQLAFRHGVLAPPEPGMIHPGNFAIETVYVDPAQLLPAFANKQGLLQSPCVRCQPVNGWNKLTLAEYRPPTPAPTSTTPAVKAPPVKAPLKVGDRCPVCGAEVRERALLNRTFVGCLC
jgi:hypothetical protein